MPADLFTVAECAKYLRISTRTVYTLVNEGKIPGFKVAGRWRFSGEELDRWMDAKSKEGLSDQGK